MTEKANVKAKQTDKYSTVTHTQRETERKRVEKESGEREEKVRGERERFAQTYTRKCTFCHFSHFHPF